MPIAQGVFDEHMPGKNQIRTPAEAHAHITAENLLEIPQGQITEFGLRRNVEVALRYIEYCLRGHGCVPIFHLMEDAATAEICRAQLWQWIHYGAAMEDGRLVNAMLFRQSLDGILQSVRQAMGDAAFQASRFIRAAELLRELSEGEFCEFLTTPASRDLD